MGVRVYTEPPVPGEGEYAEEAALDRALIDAGLGTCNGCPGLDEPRCVQACPGDLMALDPETGRACCRNDADCWDCFACAKACPRRAIIIRLPYELAGHRAALIPKVTRTAITWSLVNPDGRIETFDVPTRVPNGQQTTDNEE